MNGFGKQTKQISVHFFVKKKFSPCWTSFQTINTTSHFLDGKKLMIVQFINGFIGRILVGIPRNIYNQL